MEIHSASDNGGEHPYMDKWWVPGLNIGYEHSFINQFADFVEGYGSRKKRLLARTSAMLWKLSTFVKRFWIPASRDDGRKSARSSQVNLVYFISQKKGRLRPSFLWITRIAFLP